MNIRHIWLMIYNRQSKYKLYYLIPLVSLGAAFETYDFVIYIFYADLLAKVFFPASSAIDGYIKVLIVFLCGYLSRPLGGLFLGWLADKIRPAKVLLISFLLMGAATIAIGCLPDYASIGKWSSFLLVIFRFISGFSIGGEYPSALTFIYEITPNGKKAFFTSILYSFTGLGVLFAIIVSIFLHHYFSTIEILNYGWRIPFILGGVILLFGCYLRYKLLAHIPLKVSSGTNNTSRSHFLIFVTTTIILITPAAFAAGNLFFPHYVQFYLKHNKNDIFTLLIISNIIFFISNIIFGFITDKVGHIKLMGTGLILALLFPLHYFLIYGTNLWVSLSFITFTIITSMITGPMNFLIAESFPLSIRCRSVGICYNLSFAVIGGLTPLILTYLLETTHKIIAPSWYYNVIIIVSFSALLLYHRNKWAVKP